jgi:hypothetical protein
VARDFARLGGLRPLDIPAECAYFDLIWRRHCRPMVAGAWHLGGF